MKNFLNDLHRAWQEYRKYLSEMDLRDEANMIGYGLGHQQMNAHYPGERVIRPNRGGELLLAMSRRYIAVPLRLWKMERCDHPSMIDESYGGPDSGCMAGSCPDCGFSYHHTLY